MNIGFFQSFRAALATLFGAIVLGFLTPTLLSAQEAEPPVGTWDIVLSGKMRGVAFATFNEDGSITGIVADSFKGGSRFATNRTGIILTNQFGSAELGGHWVYERTNRISGFVNFISQGPTNLFTNGLSFRGVARATRLNLEAYGIPGKVSLRGIRYAETNAVDLGSDVTYLGAGKSSRLPFPTLEIFNLTLSAPNFYEIIGEGPGFTYSGLFLLSNQRFAALYQDRGPVPASRVAAYAGPFNVARRRGTLIGTDGINFGIKYRIMPELQAPAGNN